MKRLEMTKKLLVLVFGVVFLYGFIFSGPSVQNEYEPKSYDDAKVLRVKYTQGEAFVQRSYDEGYEEASINLPIFEKDTAGTTEGRLEIYLGRLNYLRLDRDTRVDFETIPLLRKTNLSIRVSKGGIYLDIENIDHERDIEIQTADCGVFLLDKGIYRINVTEENGTEVFVYDGAAEVSGTNYSRNVRENQKIVMLNGEVSERPFYFYSSEKDDFDLWNETRNRAIGYSRHSSSRYLDEGYEDYEYELTRSGRWRYHTEYRTYIWIPYDIGPYWRPYYHGRWIWNPYYGYVWSSFDTWGWYTHYYGRWHWDLYYGWYWFPGYRWSPAWVGWFWDDYYWGWCPWSRWNRPLIIINKRWLRGHNYHRNGIPVHSRGTTIVKKGYLTAANIHKVAVSGSRISKKAIVYRGGSPPKRPIVSKVSVVNAKGRTVVYKKGGIGTSKNYKMITSPTDVSKTGKSSRTVYKYSGTKISKGKSTRYTGSTVSGKTVYKRDSSTYKKTGKTSTAKYKPTSKSSKTTSKSSGSTKSTTTKKVKKKDSSPNYSDRGGSSSYSTRGGTSSYSSKYSSRNYRSYKSYRSYYSNNPSQVKITSPNQKYNSTSNSSKSSYKYHYKSSSKPTSSRSTYRSRSNYKTYQKYGSSDSSSDYSYFGRKYKSSSSTGSTTSSYRSSSSTYSRPTYSSSRSYRSSSSYRSSPTQSSRTYSSRSSYSKPSYSRSRPSYSRSSRSSSSRSYTRSSSPSRSTSYSRSSGSSRSSSSSSSRKK